MRIVFYTSRFFRPYLVLAIAIFAVTALLAPGYGFLEQDRSYQILILEEMLRHEREEFLTLGTAYCVMNIYWQSISGYTYLLLPILSFGIIACAADEKRFGYGNYIRSRIGDKRYVRGNYVLLFLSGMTVISIGTGILLFLFFLKFSAEYFSVWNLMGNLVRLYLTAWIGGLLSYFVLLLSGNKFYAFTVPILVFYFENECCLGLWGGKLSRFSVQGLISYTDWWSFCVFILFAGVLLIDGNSYLERRNKQYGS
ncbi:MAG: hypothetical protein ACI4SE_10015 [Lachnospiraceae bacterium]